jgi:hypothetical protein
MAIYEQGGEAHFLPIDAEIGTGRWIAACRREFPEQTDALSSIPENGLPFSLLSQLVRRDFSDACSKPEQACCETDRTGSFRSRCGFQWRLWVAPQTIA